MWTLIIVVLISNISNGGAGTTISTLDFQDQEKCQTAANATSVLTAGIPIPKGRLDAAYYQIRATCVARQ
jgi:hypothetical protein